MPNNILQIGYPALNQAAGVSKWYHTATLTCSEQYWPQYMHRLFIFLLCSCSFFYLFILHTDLMCILVYWLGYKLYDRETGSNSRLGKRIILLIKAPIRTMGAT